MKKTKDIIIFRLFLCAVFLFAFIFLLYMAIVPTGKIIYKYNFDKKSSFISSLTPKERLTGFKNNIIKANPIYFNLYTPRSFNQANLHINYSLLEQNQNIFFESGILVDKIVWRYDLLPVENNLLDELAHNWTIIKDGSVKILIRPNASSTLYNNLAEFEKNPPNVKEIGVYNYQPNIDYILTNYEAQENERQIDISLLGSYQFFTYIKDEDLNFKFDFKNIDSEDKNKEVDVFLYYENLMIYSWHIQADNSLEANLPALPEGVYKLEIKTGKNILTQTIKTKQSKLSFIHQLNIARQGKEKISFVTNSEKIQATTIYPDSLQEIRVGKQFLKLEQTYQQFTLTLDASTSLSNIQIEKDGLSLSGDGLFALSDNDFINPSLKKIIPGVNISKINYILTRYQSPKKNRDGSRRVDLSFDLHKAYRENGQYGFLLSLPNLHCGLDNENCGVVINSISVNLKGKSLLDKIKETIWGK